MSSDDTGRGLLATAEHRAGRIGGGGYAFVLCLVTLAAAGLVGLLLHRPLLFPSLGPTVMLFFDEPLLDGSSPRNTLTGHAVAIVAGELCLLLFGLTHAPSVFQEGVTGPRIAAAALSVALTVLVLKLLGMPHAPAGATTLIVSLGLLASPADVLAIAGGVVLVTVLGVGLNRLLGVRQPWWS